MQGRNRVESVRFFFIVVEDLDEGLMAGNGDPLGAAVSEGNGGADMS